jgi:hypothetical protein
MPCPSHYALIMQFAPASYYFIPFWSTYSPIFSILINEQVLDNTPQRYIFFTKVIFSSIDRSLRPAQM